MEIWLKNIKLQDDELITSYFSKFFNTDISIRFVGTNNQIQPNQANLVTDVIKNEIFWIEKAIDALIQYYKETYADYKIGWELSNLDDAVIEQYLPKEINQTKLLKLITPSEIYISPEESCEYGTFGFGLECEWDIEHGLGVYFKNWEVYEVGSMDVAFG
ncbi:MAG: hypothetical protein MUC49_06030 [Raineya sp.]|jgi:hypothetical protein|nr:hypothetical protein [Raineya sp.]